MYLQPFWNPNQISHHFLHERDLYYIPNKSESGRVRIKVCGYKPQFWGLKSLQRAMFSIVSLGPGSISSDSDKEKASNLLTIQAKAINGPLEQKATSPQEQAYQQVHQ